MSRAARLALVLTALLLTLAAAAGASFATASYAVSHSEKQWCATLDLLTSVKVTPPADPARDQSREGQYRLYTDFVFLKSRFGC